MSLFKNERIIAILIWAGVALLAYFVIKHLVLINKTIKETQP
jgi:hypothetical protein